MVPTGGEPFDVVSGGDTLGPREGRGQRSRNDVAVTECGQLIRREVSAWTRISAKLNNSRRREAQIWRKTHCPLTYQNLLLRAHEGCLQNMSKTKHRDRGHGGQKLNYFVVRCLARYSKHAFREACLYKSG